MPARSNKARSKIAKSTASKSKRVPKKIVKKPISKNPEDVEEKYIVCRYCGEHCLQSEATEVPISKPLRKKWVENLGEKFANNIKITKSNKICLSHMTDGQRGLNRLPMPMDEDPNYVFTKPEPKKRTYATNLNRKCAYCNVSQEPKELTDVPKDKSKLKEWKKRLGPDFEKRIATRTRNRICKDHMEDRDRTLSVLPKRLYTPPENKEKENREKEVEEEKDNEEENEEEVHQEEMEVDNEEEEHGMEQRRVEDEQAMEMENADVAVRSPQPIAPVAEEARTDEPSVEPTTSVAKEARIDRLAGQPIASMGKEVNADVIPKKTRGASSAQRMSQWLKSKPAANEKVVKTEPVEEEATSSGDSVPTEVKMEVDSGTTSTTAPPIVIKEEPVNQEEAGCSTGTENSENGTITCRCCEGTFEKESMVSVPQDEVELRVWKEHLGDKFAKNVRDRSAQHFICSADLKNLFTKFAQKNAKM